MWNVRNRLLNACCCWYYKCTYVCIYLRCSAFTRCYNIYFSIRRCGFRQKSFNLILINNYIAHMSPDSQLYSCATYMYVWMCNKNS